MFYILLGCPNEFLKFFLPAGFFQQKRRLPSLALVNFFLSKMFINGKVAAVRKAQV